MIPHLEERQNSDATPIMNVPEEMKAYIAPVQKKGCDR
jgi:hypothetical protein